jgi:hypothetical protein
MTRGIAERDADRIEKIFAKRIAAAEAATNDTERYLALRGIADDFAGLRNVTTIAARASELARDEDVKDELRRGREDDNHETDLLLEIKAIEKRLASTRERQDALHQLRQRWKRLSEQGREPKDSSERRMSRRVLSLLAATITTTDPDYRAIIDEYRPARRSANSTPGANPEP